jgi:IS30 family transposase
MAYKRVTAWERTLIYEWKQAGVGIHETARRLNRSAGTISREIKRNTGLANYRPKQAQAAATARARRTLRTAAFYRGGATRCRSSDPGGVDAGYDW